MKSVAILIAFLTFATVGAAGQDLADWNLADVNGNKAENLVSRP